MALGIDRFFCSTACREDCVHAASTADAPRGVSLRKGSNHVNAAETKSGGRKVEMTVVVHIRCSQPIWR